MFRIPAQPMPGDEVRLRLRILKTDRPVLHLVVGGKEVPMIRSSEVGLYAYYEAKLQVAEADVRYHFKIEYEDETVYYNKLGCQGHVNTYYDFRIIPGFVTPEWAQGAVIYQIFTDRFCNGCEENDVISDEYAYINGHSVKVPSWDTLPSTFDVRSFYGGDLQGVMQKLDYLQDLGVDVLYFNPIFVSPSNHKYDAQDYDYIDPHLAVIKRDDGTLLPKDSMDNSVASRYIHRVTEKENLEASNAYFAELVKELHRRGMRVILDGVFNHCGSFNRWLDGEHIYEDQQGYAPGAFITEDSPYHTYFTFFEGGHWPYNREYDGWWAMETLPKLNYEDSPQLVKEIMRIGRKWVSEPYCVDGWRLDVAADLGRTEAFNHKFWKQFRSEVKKAKEDAVILAEHYGDPTAWLSGGEWDTVMNYDAFMEPVTWFLTGMDKHSDKFDGGLLGNGDWFFRTMTHNMSKFVGQSLHIAMNELSNHDHSRFLTRTNNTVGRLATRGSEAAARGIKKGVFRAAVVIQMTWPGAPTIYYGDEAGVVGWTDPDNRRSFPWGHEDVELQEFHHYMIKIHKSVSSLKSGSLMPLLGEYGLIAYGRFDTKNGAVVIVNQKEEWRTVYVPVWRLGIPEEGAQLLERVMMTSHNGYSVGRVMYDVHEGYVAVEMGPMTSCVLLAGNHDYM